MKFLAKSSKKLKTKIIKAQLIEAFMTTESQLDNIRKGAGFHCECENLPLLIKVPNFVFYLIKTFSVVRPKSDFTFTK
jgi:hypothetical protein